MDNISRGYSRLMKSKIVEHIFNTRHTYINIETNLEILHTLLKDPKLNTTEQYEIYKHYKPPSRRRINRWKSGQLLFLRMENYPFRRMNHKLANCMKMWKGNGNTTTLLFSLKGIKKEEDK